MGGGGGIEQKVLFRTGWNHIFFVSGFIKDRGRKVSSKCHLFSSDVNQENEEAE